MEHRPLSNHHFDKTRYLIYSLWVAGSIIILTISLFLNSSFQKEHQNNQVLILDKGAAILENELKSFVHGLQGLAGVFHINDYKPEASKIRKYAESRQLYSNFEGALGFGFVRKVLNKDESNYIKNKRKEIPNFTIKHLQPTNEAKQYDQFMIIENIEPLEKNLSALGLNVASEENRRQAAANSASLGEPQITKPIQLVQAHIKEPGYLLFQPVYKTNIVPSTQNERINNLVGWTYSPILQSSLDQTIQKYINNANYVIDISNEPFVGDIKGKTKSIRIFGEYFYLLIKEKTPDTLRIETKLILFSSIFIEILFTFFMLLVYKNVKNSKSHLEILTSIFQKNTDGIAILDFEFKFIEYNDSVLRTFSKGNETIIGKMFSQISPQQQFDGSVSERKIQQYFEEAKITGNVRFEWCFKSPSKGIFPAEVTISSFEHLNQIGYLVIWRDLQHFKKIENDRKQLESAIHSSAIVAVTDKNGKIIEVNDNFCFISGYNRSELIGKDHRIINSGYHDKSFFENMWTTIKSGQTWSSEICNRNKKGEIYWVLTYITPLYDAQNNLEKFISIRFDITTKKQNELQYFQNSKLIALGEVTSGVAHEINNPLMIINGKISSIKKKILSKTIDLEDLQSELTKMESTTSRIVNIIHGLRKFSRDSSQDPETVFKSSNIINDSLLLFTEKFKTSGVEIIQEDQEIFQIKGQENQLTQAFSILISNSYDAIEDLQSKWIKISTKKVNNSIQISVTDSGQGIPKHVSDRLFQPLFTTKEVGRGTGLGLSISKGIIEQHKGKIYFNSQSENTQFIIELPI